MHNSRREDPVPELYQALMTLKTEEEFSLFFNDLCTKKEIHALEQRFQVARMLHDGHIYNEILEETGASSAIVSRVNRNLQNGSAGYEIAFSRLDDPENEME
ncbi:MAG: hypothetical protein IKH56_04395 [Oscillospiraceae bacterium]|nr:hypothetical protein [Oscillospiraceae bacterium]